MIKISVKADVQRAMQKLQRDIQDAVRDRAVVQALNKTAEKGRSEMTRRIRDEFAIKAGDVRAQLNIVRASIKVGRVAVVLQAFGRRRGHRSRNVMMFGARQTSQGVTVKIKRSGGRKLLKGAFIANAGRTVFMREGKGRLPIKAVETIDVPQMFNTKRINQVVVAKMKEDFFVEFDRAVKYNLSRLK